MWAGAAVLAARGVVGLVDDGLRFSGVLETGLSGLSDQEVLGTADPSAYTIWSTIGLDAFFVAGGLLFARAARRAPAGPATWRPCCPAPAGAWAAYAASAWAVAYAVGVRGYQGLGGTLGLPGTFEDPAGLRRASLLAGAGILLAGRRRAGARPPLGPAAPALARHRPRADRLRLGGGACADRLRHQAAAPGSASSTSSSAAGRGSTKAP